ncbi:transcription termination/antitermination protein NusG [Rhizobium leguminosarum]|uniref:transcription termination/antitermination protein NusG n=1 Tax=Rhizobium leguminosarum TaxID=384 RepID=UPI00067F0CBF|nr:transcription termination/antitermination NusG family protein [Rhizobium leguminosarum]
MAAMKLKEQDTRDFNEIIEQRRKRLKGRDWYAIRTAPGTQRMASHVADAPVHRVGESIIERNLRNEGISVYMPAYWYESIHHRTRKVIQRRLPLLVGYAFVNLENLNFEKVRDVEGVVCFLRSEFGPIRFSGDDLAVIAAEELSRRQEFRRERITRIQTETSGQVMQLRGNLRKILPKGRGNRINLKDQALLTIKDMKPEMQSKVMGMLLQLEQLEAYEGLETIDRVA